MTKKLPVPEDSSAEPQESAADKTTRRAFLGAASHKALYVAPVVVALSASRAYGSNAFFSFCADQDSFCTVDADCCAGLTCQQIGMTGMYRCKP